MTDISLSLGGKWLQQSMEREQQAQVIAHLTNQLEGLKAAYTEDVAQVTRHKHLLVEMQASLTAMTGERDEWKAAYEDLINKRQDRDQLVEEMLQQVQTLESGVRDEELRATDATKRSSLLQKEKELLAEKLEKTSKELDDTYGELARTKDDLATSTDANEQLTHSLQLLTRSRDSKEGQVVSLLKEKNRLFRLVTDLRSTIKVAGGSIAPSGATTPRGGPTPRGSIILSPKPGSLSIPDVEHAVAADVAAVEGAVSKRGSISHQTRASLLARPVDGSAAKPKWSSSSSVKKATTDDDAIDRMTFQGHVTNMIYNARPSARATPSQQPRSRPQTASSTHSRGSRAPSVEPRDRPRSAAASVVTDDDDSDDDESPSSVVLDDVSDDRRATAAKKNLVLRLKRQIDLLEEKNTELEKTVGMVRSENQLLLVRFRGAHDRRVLVEKKMKQTEKEIETMRTSGGANGAPNDAMTDETVSFHHGYYEAVPPPQPQHRQKPPTPTPTRWK